MPTNSCTARPTASNEFSAGVARSSAKIRNTPAIVSWCKQRYRAWDRATMQEANLRNYTKHTLLKDKNKILQLNNALIWRLWLRHFLLFSHLSYSYSLVAPILGLIKVLSCFNRWHFKYVLVLFFSFNFELTLNLFIL